MIQCTVTPSMLQDQQWVDLSDSCVSFSIDPENLKQVLSFFTPSEQSKKVEQLLQDPFSKYFEIRLGLACDNKCTHCFIANRHKEKEKTFDEIKSIIDSVPAEWILGITGGEPTIRKDFLNILAYAQGRRNTTYIQTHGRQFADIEFTKSTCRFLDGALIAIHSHLESIHDEITQAPGSGKETWQGFRNLVLDSRPFVITQTVIVRKNYQHLLEIADAIQQVNPTGRMSFTFPHPVAGAFSQDVTPSLTELKPFLHALLSKWGKQIQTHYIPRCFMHPYQDAVFNVDNYGTGEYTRPGIDVLEGDWQETDYGIDAGKTKAEGCKQCVYNSSCIGVWKEYADLYGTDELRPIIYANN